MRGPSYLPASVLQQAREDFARKLEARFSVITTIHPLPSLRDDWFADFGRATRTAGATIGILYNPSGIRYDSDTSKREATMAYVLLTDTNGVAYFTQHDGADETIVGSESKTVYRMILKMNDRAMRELSDYYAEPTGQRIRNLFRFGVPVPDHGKRFLMTIVNDPYGGGAVIAWMARSSPGWDVGLHPYERVLRMNGVPTRGKSDEQLLDLYRGKDRLDLEVQERGHSPSRVILYAKDLQWYRAKLDQPATR